MFYASRGRGLALDRFGLLETVDSAVSVTASMSSSAVSTPTYSALRINTSVLAFWALMSSGIVSSSSTFIPTPLTAVDLNLDLLFHRLALNQ